MIPFLDLKAQYISIAPELEAAVLDVLRRGDYVMGDSVTQFETAFAAFCGARQAVAVNSGTSALHLSLLAAGIGPGDEVVTVSSTFVATVAAILYAGATPVFVDIDAATWTMDPDLVEQALTPRTKAILPVHLHGRLADMERLGAISRRHGLLLIEDAAQAHGAVRDGRAAGTFGDIGCFSFYPGKNLGAYGEGGAVTTSNSKHERTIRMLRDWGQDRKYHHALRGFNYRMEGLQGAILRVKLRHLEAWTNARRAVTAQYNELLRDSEVSTPQEMPWARHVYHAYTVRSRDRDALQAALLAEGIQTGIHYPLPVHLQPAYADLGYGRGDFPQAEEAAAQVLSLPIYPELSSESVQEVAVAVKKFSSRTVHAPV